VALLDHQSLNKIGRKTNEAYLTNKYNLFLNILNEIYISNVSFSVNFIMRISPMQFNLFKPHRVTSMIYNFIYNPMNEISIFINYFIISKIKKSNLKISCKKTSKIHLLFFIEVLLNSLNALSQWQKYRRMDERE
jgi:hypothetical protein